MTLNILNQNSSKHALNLNSYMTSMLGFKFGNNINANSNSYFAQKGEPIYQKDMDSDNDGIVTFDDFKNYCKENDISSKQMAKMLQNRIAYQLSKENVNSEQAQPQLKTGSLDLIYAESGEDNFDEKMDFNSDSKISYAEYLRYCEQNAKTAIKHSDTKIKEDSKNRFMTISFDKIATAYQKNTGEVLEGKIESEA